MSKCIGCCKMMIMTLFVAMLCMNTSNADNKWGHNYFNGPKYIFFFIGDGMASPQIHATEAYLAAMQADDTEPGGIKAEKLAMSEFPVQGMQMSFANNRFITNSAAAGTALACGMKTNIGVIAMDPDATIAYTSLAEAANAKGMKVGIVTSVSIDHATPAVFYAHEPSRNNYEQIGEWLLNSDFDYFGGGGFRVDEYKSETYADLSNEERYAIVEATAVANGFTFANTRAEFDALKRRDGRAIAINPYLDSRNAIPYALNRMAADGPGEDYEGSISLAEFTKKGIQLLKNRKGFFMMVEGGKIDWACHANDARAAIEDIIAFDNAIAVAVKFARRHPRETLIVVTGDHECGGMTLGFAGTLYETYYEIMANQTIAYDDFGIKILIPYAADKIAHGSMPADIDADMWYIILNNYGMDGAGLTADKGDDLSEYAISLLEDAFDKTMNGGNNNPEEENMLLYGFYDPLTVTLTHLLNYKSGLAWTSYSHTAVPVPVFAMGPGAKIFDGYYDNTDVAKKMAKIMGVKIGD